MSLCTIMSHSIMSHSMIELHDTSIARVYVIPYLNQVIVWDKRAQDAYQAPIAPSQNGLDSSGKLEEL